MRYLTPILALLSALLAIHLLLSWPFHERDPGILQIPFTPTLKLYSYHGDIELCWEHPDPRFADIAHIRDYHTHNFLVGSYWSTSLSQPENGYSPGTVAERTLSLRIWFLSTLLAIPTVIYILTLISSRHRPQRARPSIRDS